MVSTSKLDGENAIKTTVEKNYKTWSAMHRDNTAENSNIQNYSSPLYF